MRPLIKFNLKKKLNNSGRKKRSINDDETETVAMLRTIQAIKECVNDPFCSNKLM